MKNKVHFVLLSFDPPMQNSLTYLKEVSVAMELFADDEMQLTNILVQYLSKDSNGDKDSKDSKE